MPAVKFDRDSWARTYARSHIEMDAGIIEVYHLPNGADDNEVRLVEVNDLMAGRTNESLKPIDFGIDRGTANFHRLLLLDVTPDQWNEIREGSIALPNGWNIDGCEKLS